MQLRAQLFLFSIKIEIGKEKCSDFWKMFILKYFWLV